ncbi:MAG TPA: alkaline phosphatase family protein [Candidatus Eisenbacteria bacterium]|nr:alkaline phosphatase family protein [Candidatus Eisenbacteria bacterium]
MPKVLIIGLDGATWTVLEPWARAGRMPRLAALMDRGTWGPLRSTIPALTMPSWSSFVTGKNPGGHGIYAFTRTAPHAYEPGGIANAAHLRSATLWDHLGQAGRSVGVINVPPSYPLRPVNGYVVGCMLTPPGERFTEPAEIATELDGYQIDLKAPRQLRANMTTYAERSTTYLSALCTMTQRRADAVVRLMVRHPTDVVCVVFYSPDRVQHNFWDELDDRPRSGDDARVRRAVEEVYSSLDAALGRVIDASGPDATVILASDHGFVPKPAQSVRINRWLADHGLLAEHRLWTLRRKVIRSLPEAWRGRWDTLDHIQVRRPATAAWAETLDNATAGIWVHLRGRYPLGCVEPGAAYEAVRTRIVDGLGALRDGAGRPVFRSVLRREDQYHGPFVDEAPDVMAVCNPGFGVLNYSLRRDLRSRELFGFFDEAGFTGTHDPAGIYLFAGASVRALGRHDEYPIESIAPTVLYLLDVPIPRSMDGPVCTSVLDPQLVATTPPVYTDVEAEARSAATWASAEDEAHVAEHLRSLGYME